MYTKLIIILKIFIFIDFFRMFNELFSFIKWHMDNHNLINNDDKFKLNNLELKNVKILT